MRQLTAAECKTLSGTLAVCVVLLVALEVRFPYYFLQDDGLEYYLPVYVHNYRSLISGQLPLYSWHTFGGVPHASMGQPAVFYAPIYVAVGLSRLIWGHPFAAMDILGFINALIAVAGTYCLFRYLKCAPTAASLGGLMALSGFFLWFGRMWFSATMLAAWFPWMVWAGIRYLRNPRASRAAWVIFFRLCLLYAGHSQFFVLAVLFEHLFAGAWCALRRPRFWLRRVGAYAALNFAVLVLGLPFLVTLAVEVNRSFLRSSPMPYWEFSVLSMTAGRWIVGQLFVFLSTPAIPAIFERQMPYLPWASYVTILGLFLSVPLWLRRPALRPWLTAAGICFALGVLWSMNVGGPVLYHVPVLNRFRFPFKLIYFGLFFESVLAIFAITHWKELHRRIALVAFMANWMWVLLYLPNHAWRVRDYHPPLVSPWHTLLQGGRYVALENNPLYSPSDAYVEFNYALLFGLDNLMGYEPMHSQFGAKVALGNLHTGVYEGQVTDAVVRHLKRWSVRYVLLSPERAHTSAVLANAGYRLKASANGWSLWEDPAVLPRVRWVTQESKPARANLLHWTKGVNSLDIDVTGSEAGQLKLAFAANPGLEVCIDERCRPGQGDEEGLLQITVPSGAKHVRVIYRNRLLLLSILIAVVAGAVLPAVLRHAHHRGSFVTRERSQMPIQTVAL